MPQRMSTGSMQRKGRLVEAAAQGLSVQRDGAEALVLSRRSQLCGLLAQCLLQGSGIDTAQDGVKRGVARLAPPIEACVLAQPVPANINEAIDRAVAV
ncbi:hypothetical protein BUE93_22240, partial [Chromobacterium amazonense]